MECNAKIQLAGCSFVVSAFVAPDTFGMLDNSA
jgi:hypothetical protein